MVVIPYKTFTLKIPHFQGRRILCDACGNPFTYLARGGSNGKDVGLPLLSRNDRMAVRARPEALHRVVRAARARERGVGLQTSCRTQRGILETRGFQRARSGVGCDDTWRVFRAAEAHIRA